MFRKRCRAFRALVARHTVFVNPPSDGPSKPLLEKPELGTLGKVVSQRRALEDRRANPGQLQRHRLTLALGNSRVVGFEDQMDRIVGREEQPPEQDPVGNTDCLVDRNTGFEALAVTFECQPAAPLDHPSVTGLRRVPLLEKLPEALAEPRLIGSFHRRAALAFPAPARRFGRRFLFLGLLLFLSLLFCLGGLLLLTAQVREVVVHTVGPGVKPDNT